MNINTQNIFKLSKLILAIPINERVLVSFSQTNTLFKKIDVKYMSVVSNLHKIQRVKPPCDIWVKHSSLCT